MKEIQLSKQGKMKGKYFALVDDEDFERINSFNWYLGRSGNTLYAARTFSVQGKKFVQYMHGAIMNRKSIDHIDHNGLNNQKSNLRFCTVSENNMNQRKQENRSSIYKGVSFNKRTGKWKAEIQINGKRIHLGRFILEVEAARAYNAKAISLFLEFANLNIIPNEELEIKIL